MRPKHLYILVWLLGAVLTLERARASELRWDGSGSCSDASQLGFELERVLGKPLAEAGNLAFEVRVQAASETTSARLQVRAETGDSSERTLVASDCARLVEMLTIAISLAIDTSEQDPAAQAPSAKGMSPPKPLLPEGSKSPEPSGVGDVMTGAGSPKAGGGLTPSTSAFVVGDVGSLPQPALGVGLGIQLGWPRFRVELMATTLFARRVTWSGSTAGAEVSLDTAAARACLPALSQASSLAIPFCLGAEVGRLQGVGRGVSPARSRGVLWLAPRAEVGLSWEIPDTWLSLETTLAAVVPLARDEFVLDGMGAIHRPSGVVGRLGASLGIRFE